MDKSKIKDYLEGKLSSHPNNITDANDRLVWLSDVVEKVEKLIREQALSFDNYHEFEEWIDNEGWYESTTHHYDNTNDNSTTYQFTIEELYEKFLQSKNNCKKENPYPTKCIYFGNEYDIKSIDFDTQGQIVSVRLVVFDGEDFDFPQVNIDEIEFKYN